MAPLHPALRDWWTMIWGGLLSVGGVAWLLAAEHRGSPARNVAKPLASAGFLLVAVAGEAADTGFGRWVLVGLVLAAVGDVLLLGSRSAAFVGGLGAFLLAHVAYSVGFGVRGVAGAGVAAIPFGLLALVVLRWLDPHVSGSLRGPVVAYAIAISVMGALAVATAAAEWDWRLPAGALLFLASDVAVARNRFVTPGFQNKVWGLPAYYAGQLLLAWAATG